MKRPIIALILILLPSTFFLLLPGTYYNMHDDLQVIRQLELEKCLKDLQIPCRWSPDLNFGYGYPMFNFYPPLPYLIGEFFRIFSLDLLTTIKLTAFLQIMLSGIFMFRLAKELTNDNRPAFLSAILYVYAPYHALNIFVRGAMNEAWASVFFPLIFLYAIKLSKYLNYRYLLLLSLAIGLLLLSHLPMAIIFLPTIYGLSLVYGLKNGTKPKSFLLLLVISLILGFGYTAFFTLPAVLESHLTQIKTMFVGYYSYTAHFATIKEIFLNNFWNNGSSVWGPKDGLSFMVGYIHWLLPSAIFIYSIFKRKKNPFLFYFLFLLTIINLFMTHQRSIIIWNTIGVIQNIQFPWRFLNPATFYACLTSIYLFRITKNRIFYLLLIFLTIAINYPYFIPVQWGKVSESQKISGLSWEKMISNLYDYLPNSASRAANKPASPGIDSSDPGNIYQVNNLKQGTNWMFINFTASESGNISLSQIDFPQTNIYIDGNKVKHTVDPEFGRVVVEVNPGQHLLYLQRSDTTTRRVANLVSMITLFGLIVFTIWKKQISKIYN